MEYPVSIAENHSESKNEELMEYPVSIAENHSGMDAVALKKAAGMSAAMNTTSAIPASLSSVSNISEVKTSQEQYGVLSQSCLSIKASIDLPTNVDSSSKTVDVLDLISDSTVKDQDFTVLEKMEEAYREKSSYEIAAEALCLMKSGGVSIGNNSFCLGLPPARNTTDLLKVNGSNSVVNTSRVNLPATCTVTSNTAVSTDAVGSNDKPTKYVLVPENALLTSVKTGNLVPIEGTPYFIMVQSRDIASSKLLSAAGVSSGQNVLSTSAHETSAQFMNCLDVSQEVEVSDVGFTEISNGSGKRTVSKKHDALKFPPCVICGGEASGMHYGCNTCEACKNFFRRCLLRKTSPPFTCHGGNDCEISYKKNKNNCSACRLAKCLAFGMAKEKCKMGRYTSLMRTETIKKVRILEGKDEDEIISVDSPVQSSDELMEISDNSLEPEPRTSGDQRAEDRDIYGAMISKQILTCKDDFPKTSVVPDYDEKLIKLLVDYMDNIKPWGEHLDTEESRLELVKNHYEKYRAKVEMFGQLGNVSKEEYQTLLRKYGIDIDGQWAMFKMWSTDLESIVSKYCLFAKQIPNFRSLSYDDQACLLKTTHCAFFAILMHKAYYREYEIFLELNGTPFHIEEASDKFFSRNLILLLTGMYERLQRLNLTRSEMALLMAITTMSPDQCKVENGCLVEDSQLQMTELLLREMSKAYGQATVMKRFTSIIDALTVMRDVSNVYYKEYRALCNDTMIKESIPNVDCILPDNE